MSGPYYIACYRNFAQWVKSILQAAIGVNIKHRHAKLANAY